MNTLEYAAPKEDQKIINAAVLVAALGYFVDIYDLVLFSIVRKASLISLGFSGTELESKGLLLINLQMFGMLIGGIIWGVLGDKRGRLSVLFGSILMYSVANLLNGFSDGITSYAILRFVAGIGLAGELGAGITLVSESLPKDKRGYGTMIVATVGVSGAVVAGLVAEYLNWRWAYRVGGGLGLMLLLLRIGVFESGLFNHIKTTEVARGNFFSLFATSERFFKYLKCILIGVPLWFVVGLLVSFSPELAVQLKIDGVISAGTAIMCCYGGLTLGDFASGLISQLLKSRKKVVLLFIFLMAMSITLYLSMHGASTRMFYFICFLLGVSSGYWAIFATTAAEQFGTNLRATVATTAPNFVRGTVPLITALYLFLQHTFHFEKLTSAGIVGLICLIAAFVSALYLEESFDKDLNFLEL